MHISGGGKGCTLDPARLYSILLVVEMYTPCMSILLAVERNTPCTSIILVVGRGTTCTSILLAAEMYLYTLHDHTVGSGKDYTLKCLYCWRKKCTSQGEETPLKFMWN